MREAFGSDTPKARHEDVGPIEVNWEKVPIAEMTASDWKRLVVYIAAAGHDAAKVSTLLYLGLTTTEGLIHASTKFMEHYSLPRCGPGGAMPDDTMACRWRSEGKATVRVRFIPPELFQKGTAPPLMTEQDWKSIDYRSPMRIHWPEAEKGIKDPKNNPIRIIIEPPKGSWKPEVRPTARSSEDPDVTVQAPAERVEAIKKRKIAEPTDWQEDAFKKTTP